MKRFLFFIIVLGSVLFLTGCNLGNKIVCTGTTEESGKSVKMNIVANLKGDIVKDVSATFKFNDKETATYFCNILKLANDQVKDGNKIEFTCNGSTVIIKDFLKFSNSSEATKEITKEEFIKQMESGETNIKCK